MKRNLWAVVALAWVSSVGLAAGAERWMHVNVIDNGEDGDHVRVNIPLSLAEKVLPTIKVDQFHDGLMKFDGHVADKVDVRALLAAVRDAQDNEYVTVDSRHQSVRVAKSGGFLLVKVHETSGAAAKSGEKRENTHDSTVDIKIPFTVVNALLSGEKDELNLLAAVRALNNNADVDLVTVNDAHSKVRIWVDSKNVAE